MTRATEPPTPHADRPEGTDRRGFLRSAGLTSAGVLGAAASGPARAEGDRGSGNGRPAGELVWLAGDHHLHSQYSNDAMFRIEDQARRAVAGGLDWIVITDHGNAAFAAHSIGPQREAMVAARERYADDLLIFNGLEWNIPAGEHTTLMMAPGDAEAEVLQEFVDTYDANVVDARDGTPAHEDLALDALTFLAKTVSSGRLDDVLVLPNHPARKGIDSPAELRAWQDAAPEVVIGFEGAPGHQAAALPAGMARGRGLYDGSAGEHSFPGYPEESYRTWGGFDWMTATVGGMWDSLLAEGRKWWITTTSDGHQGCGDWVKNPVDDLDETGYSDRPYNDAGDTFDSTGVYPPPVGAGRPVLEYSSFTPGAYNKTWVGATDVSHLAVMEGMRAGRMWVCFGDLIASLDMSLQVAGRRGDRFTVGMGETLEVTTPTEVELTLTIGTADQVNHAGLLPQLARVDLIMGRLVGPTDDPDSTVAPDTKVVTSWDTTEQDGTIELTHRFTLEHDVYLRVRGTDGKRSQPGYLGAAIDPVGPAIDVPGEVNPWEDLWFYTNPIFARRG
jgi:PHP domain